VAAAFKPELTGDVIGAEGEIVKADPQAVHSDAQIVSYLGTGTLNGYQVASFAVNPFGVKAGTLHRAGHVELEIETKPLTSTTAQRIRHRDGWREGVRAHIASMVINPGAQLLCVRRRDGGTGTNGFWRPRFPRSRAACRLRDHHQRLARGGVPGARRLEDSKGVSTVVRTTGGSRPIIATVPTVRRRSATVKDAHSLWASSTRPRRRFAADSGAAGVERVLSRCERSQQPGRHVLRLPRR
jgi:hypothetical protein